MLCALITKNVLQNSRNEAILLTIVHDIQEYKMSTLESKSLHWSDGFDIIQCCYSTYNLIEIDIATTKALDESQCPCG
jgi:hypothetical protein